MKGFLVSALVGFAKAADWAVIVAGSNTYGNYRHQADACHAYQVSINFGIPADRIILMAYDDIANSAQNPFKGQMFNKPSAGPGVDVYKGCQISYKGADVTPQNFVGILTGVSTKGLPVLKSGPNDNVFVFFSDHGATGLIAFPSSTMSATMLNNALKTAKSKNMFSKLVFYLEACESGSMFEGILDPSLGIYATTASSASESSWGTYCPPDDKVNGKELGSCLGDLYSVNWMENADAVGKAETLAAQYEEVKKATTQSQVKQYGDMSYTSEAIGDFMGDVTTNTTVLTPRSESSSSSNVRSRDIPMHLAYYRYLRAHKLDFGIRQQLAADLQKMIASRVKADSMFMTLANKVSLMVDAPSDALFSGYPKKVVACGACCDQLQQTYENTCGQFDDYTLEYYRVLVNVCEAVEYKPEQVEVVSSFVSKLCKE